MISAQHISINIVHVFIYIVATGSDWSSFNNDTFVPVFFNADLTVMFPNEQERTAATKLCNSNQPTDDTPEVRRECYFDFKVSLGVFKS